MSTVTIPQRLDFDALAPTYAKALAHLDNAAVKEFDRVGIDPGLRELSAPVPGSRARMSRDTPPGGR